MEFITDLSQFASLPYLKVSDVNEGDTLLITSSIKKEINKWGKEVLTFYVKHRQVDKIASVNAKSPQVQKLVAILGANPMSWIGKSVRCKVVTVALKTGKEVQALEFF